MEKPGTFLPFPNGVEGHGPGNNHNNRHEVIYQVIRAQRAHTQYLLRSVLLFWMVEPLSCRSFYKRDQEIFRTFLSSLNIGHWSKYMKKLALTVLVFRAPNRPGVSNGWKPMIGNPIDQSISIDTN